MHRIKISTKNMTAYAELNESATANAIWNALPIVARANTWGDEIYFEIPVRRQVESDATDVVVMGNLGYWPPGEAFCIFFGPTPASHGEEIRAASAVNIVGHVQGDAKIFKQVKNGTTINIERSKE